MPRYHHCIGATFTEAVAPLLLIELNGDATFPQLFWRYAQRLLFSTDNCVNFEHLTVAMVMIYRS